MEESIKKYLQELAEKYEVPKFTEQDPSQFLRWYKVELPDSIADVECASLIAAMLAFGNRRQFIPKIQGILAQADKETGSISKWLKQGVFRKKFPTGSQKFYRFYSFTDMQLFFEEISQILQTSPNLGDYFCSRFFKIKEGEVSPSLPSQVAMQSAPTESDGSHRFVGLSATPSAGGNSPRNAPLKFNSNAEIISFCFAQAFPNSAIVPKGKASANKRIHMFLRWMVRQNSPVDLGLWSWYNPADLLIPLDVHVMQESIKLGLLPANATASYRTAQLLTKQMEQAFPNDPCRADFALFGLGVN